MNRITKYLFFVVIGLISLQARAQSFALIGGVNLNDVFYESAGEKWSNIYNMTTPGFHLGGAMTNSLTDILTLETGLLVSLKGFKLDALNDPTAYGVKTHLFYIDLPVLLKANYDLGESLKWFLAAGPFFNLGLAGNYIAMYDWGDSGQGAKEKVKWGNGEDEIKRFDVGVSMGGGMEFNVWQVGIYYDMGFADLSPATDKIVKNRLWKISLAYKLGGKK